MVKEPESMEELVYMTNRILDKGSIRVWVYKRPCPKCGKGLMGKPKDAKTGRPKVRAKEYVCPECSHTMEKEEYEETLEAEAKYVCPECGHNGEAAVPFKRKKIQGVETLRFTCGSCKANLDVTKKMKKKKKK